ncbi:MAG TPA: hypothetical protein VNI79_00510 [Sphingomicrobium sp.]|nr:hypothetical protein [Sphingomicrobium sp.]
MDIRKMKPRNGWRTFFDEVGKIVLGVLVALGLGVIATEIGWRVEVGRAREALAFELGETVGQADERIKYAPCVERRLDELAGIVEAAAISGRIPPLGEIYGPSFRTWNRGVWDSAVSSQTASHFPREETEAFVSLNEFVNLLQETGIRELEVWTTLYGVVGPGRAILPGEVASLREAIGKARFLHRMISMAAIRGNQIAVAFDLIYDDATARDYSDRPLSSYNICKPIGADAPKSYGQAPLRNILQRAAENPITRIR